MVETWEARQRKHTFVEKIRWAVGAEQQQASLLRGKPRSNLPYSSKLMLELVLSRHREIAQAPRGNLHALVVDHAAPACSEPLARLDSSLKIKDMLLGTHHVGKVLIARRFGTVATAPHGGIYGIEDATGTTDLLIVDAFSFAGDQTIPADAVIAIKEPYCWVDWAGNPRIKLSHPTDLVILGPDNQMIPAQWRMNGFVASAAVLPLGRSRRHGSFDQSDISATEVRETPSAGRGLFAKKSFTLGDNILTESAIFLLLPAEDTSFNALKYDVRRNMMTEVVGAPYKELALALRGNPDMATKVFDLHSGHVARPRSADTLIDGRPVVDIFHVHEIWSHNAIACPASTKDKAFPNRVSVDSPSASGIWCHTSYCNHSCLPNAEKSFRDGVLTLRATRDINEDEEITISYSEYVDQADKQEAMYRIWGFKCECPVCEAESRVPKELLARRQALRGKLSAPLSTSLNSTAIARAKALVNDIKSTYPPSYDRDLPQTATAEALSVLFAIYSQLVNLGEAEIALLDMLKALRVLELRGEEVIPLGGMLEEATVVNVLLLAELQKKAKRNRVAENLAAFAKKIYLVLNGSVEGYDRIVVPEF